MKKSVIYLTPLFLFHAQLFAQGSDNVTNIANTPSKSGISYDALSQFFQSTLTTGKNGGFSFKSSAFGLKTLFSKQDSLSNYYLKSTNAFLRNFEISIGVNKDSSSDFSTLAAGFKYALWNRRDKSEDNFSEDQAVKAALAEVQDLFAKTNAQFKADLDAQLKDSTISKSDYDKLMASLDTAGKKYRNTLPHDVSVFPKKYIVIADSIANKDYKKKNTQDIVNMVQMAYNLAAKEIDKKGLVTLAFNPGYNIRASHFDTTSVQLEWLIGVGNANRPWNFDTQLKYIYLHDSVGKETRLCRQIAVASLGCNKTLILDNKNNPVIEFEPAIEDDYINIGSYAKEGPNKFTFNAILRIHLSSQIILPITLKYDPKHPNIFGLLQLTWNMEDQKQATGTN